MLKLSPILRNASELTSDFFVKKIGAGTQKIGASSKLT